MSDWKVEESGHLTLEATVIVRYELSVYEGGYHAYPGWTWMIYRKEPSELITSNPQEPYETKEAAIAACEKYFEEHYESIN